MRCRPWSVATGLLSAGLVVEQVPSPILCPLRRLRGAHSEFFHPHCWGGIGSSFGILFLKSCTSRVPPLPSIPRRCISMSKPSLERRPLFPPLPALLESWLTLTPSFPALFQVSSSREQNLFRNQHHRKNQLLSVKHKRSVIALEDVNLL